MAFLMDGTVTWHMPQSSVRAPYCEETFWMKPAKYQQ